MDEEDKEQGNTSKNDRQYTCKSPDVQTTIKSQEMKLNDSHSTNFALNTLLILQAASLQQRDNVVTKASSCFNSPKTEVTCLPKAQPDLGKESSQGKSYEVKLPVKPLDEGHGPAIVRQTSDVVGEVRPFSARTTTTTPVISSSQEASNEVPKELASVNCNTTISQEKNLQPQTAKFENPSSTDQSHQRVMDNETSSLSLKDVNSCARTSPCTKTSKDSPQRRCHQGVFESSTAGQRAHLPVSHIPEANLAQKSCSSSRGGNTVSKMTTGLLSRTSTLQSSPPQCIPLQNLIFASCGNLKISSAMTPSFSCAPVSCPATDRKMNTKDLSSSVDCNLRDGKIKTVPFANFMSPPQAPKQSPSLACKKTVIFISPQRSGANNVQGTSSPPIKNVTVRQQLINSRSPANLVTSPVAKSEPERTNEHAVLITETGTKPSGQIAGLLQGQKKREVNHPTSTTIASNTLSPSKRKACRSAKSGSQAPGPGSKMNLGEKHLPSTSPETRGNTPSKLTRESPTVNPPNVWWSSGGRPFALVPVHILDTTPHQSPNKQTLPRSSDPNMNPTLCSMMKHFNHTTTSVERLIDNRFLQKILSSDLYGVDDLFDELEMGEGMQQHPVPDWLLDFILESDARKRKTDRLTQRLPSADVRRKSNVPVCSQTKEKEAGKVMQGTDENRYFPVAQGGAGNATVLHEHAEDVRNVDVNDSGNSPNQNRNACCDTDKTERNSNSEDHCSTSGMTGLNSLQKTPFLGNHPHPIPHPRQRNIPVSGNIVHLGFLDLIPDLALWNLLCRLFPPWKTTYLGLDREDVDGFFKKYVQKKQRGKSRSGNHTVKACLKTEFVSNELDGSEPGSCQELTNVTRRKKSKRRKEKNRRQGDGKCDNSCDTGTQTERKSKSVDKRKRSSKEKRLLDDSHGKRKRHSGEKKKKKHHKKEMDGNCSRQSFVHSSEQRPSDNEASFERVVSPRQSDDVNEGRDKLAGTLLNKCQSVAGENETPKQKTEVTPPKWQLKLVMKAPRSKAKRGKTKRNEIK